MQYSSEGKLQYTSEKLQSFCKTPTEGVSLIISLSDQKLEELFPIQSKEILREAPLPKQKEIATMYSEDVKSMLQKFLNKILNNQDIARSNILNNFLDPLEKVLVIFV